ncbi:MAG: 30S ribosomal protein S20 [Planctomycetota bacterium]
MPNSESAKKRLRQNEARRLANRGARTKMRNQVKKVRVAVAAGDTEKSEAEFKVAQKGLDQAAAKGLIHANAAARTKARLSKAIKELKAAR